MRGPQRMRGWRSRHGSPRAAARRLHRSHGARGSFPRQGEAWADESGGDRCGSPKVGSAFWLRKAVELLDTPAGQSVRTCRQSAVKRAPACSTRGRRRLPAVRLPLSEPDARTDRGINKSLALKKAATCSVRLLCPAQHSSIADVQLDATRASIATKASTSFCSQAARSARRAGSARGRPGGEASAAGLARQPLGNGLCALAATRCRWRPTSLEHRRGVAGREAEELAEAARCPLAYRQVDERRDQCGLGTLLALPVAAPPRPAGPEAEARVRVGLEPDGLAHRVSSRPRVDAPQASSRPGASDWGAARSSASWRWWRSGRARRATSFGPRSSEASAGASSVSCSAPSASGTAPSIR